ncbi:MAG: hypothetical protein AABX55_01350 [Nanoarchaeota archaeon]
MKTWDKIKIGSATLGLVGLIYGYNGMSEANDEMGQIQNLNAVVRAYQINEQLNKSLNPIEYSKLKAEKDSLESITEFYDSRQEFIKSADKQETDNIIYFFSTMVSGLALAGYMVKFIKYVGKKFKKE